MNLDCGALNSSACCALSHFVRSMKSRRSALRSRSTVQAAIATARRRSSSGGTSPQPLRRSISAGVVINLEVVAEAVGHATPASNEQRSRQTTREAGSLHDSIDALVHYHSDWD